jgi:hypothetical protein
MPVGSSEPLLCVDSATNEQVSHRSSSKSKKPVRLTTHRLFSFRAEAISALAPQC